MNISELPDRRVRLHGTTNLPAGTDLMLSVEERTQGGSGGQSKRSVLADGSFDSEALGPSGGLEDGVYVAEVLMPVPRVQPDYVKRIIGENGEHLSGPLVKNGTLGITVSIQKQFTIGGTHGAQAQQERAKDRIQQYREWLTKIMALHARLQTARGSKDLIHWRQFARQFATDISSHRDQVAQLQSVTARFMIGTPLSAVLLMFDATASQEPQDYEEASADYIRSLKELEQFIAEAEEELERVIAEVESAH